MAGLNISFILDTVPWHTVFVSDDIAGLQKLEESDFPLTDVCYKLREIALHHNIIVKLTVPNHGPCTVKVASDSSELSVLSVQESFALTLELYNVAHHAPAEVRVKLSDEDPVVLYPDIDCDFGDVVGAIKFDSTGRSMVVGIADNKTGILTHTIDPIRGIVCDMSGNEIEELNKTLGEKMKLWYTANWRIGDE